MRNRKGSGAGSDEPTTGLWAWALYDWANTAFGTVIQTFVFAAYFTRQVAADETTGTAIWGNTVSAAALTVAIGAPILGAIADQAGRRKPWVGAFTLLCALATAALWLVAPGSSVVFAAVVVGIAIVGSEFANVFYNAMLPALASPDRIGRWSGWGWALGYVGGLACLVVSLFVFVRPDPPLFGLDPETAEHVRATFVLAAAWMLLFALPLFSLTPDQPSTGKSFGGAVRDGIAQLVDSVRHLRRYRPILRFLVARMIYIDGLATVFAFGGVYAAGTFDMDAQGVLAFGIALNVTAALGAAAFAWIDDHVGSKTTILVSLVGLVVSSAAILVVRSAALFWAFGLVLGVFVGPLQASSRSWFARVAPANVRNEMFGLFALSGKVTSFLGPLLVGWVTWLTASQRLGMATILVFFATGFVLMLGVPAARRGGLIDGDVS